MPPPSLLVFSVIVLPLIVSELPYAVIPPPRE
jgi:hypothetical protein